MTAKYPFEEPDSSKPGFVHAMTDGPLSDEIKVFMNQAGLHSGAYVWQWEAETDAIDLYTLVPMPADYPYGSLTEELRRHLTSFCEEAEQNEDCVSRADICVARGEVNRWFAVCTLRFRSPAGRLERAVGTAQGHYAMESSEDRAGRQAQLHKHTSGRFSKPRVLQGFRSDLPPLQHGIRRVSGEIARGDY
jgi:hypothetical protein